jgi:hypothetical protein
LEWLSEIVTRHGKQGGLEIHDASAILDIAPIGIVMARRIHNGRTVSDC